MFKWNETPKDILKTTIISGASFLLSMALVLFILSYALLLVKRIAEPISRSLHLDQLSAAAGVGAVTVLSALLLVVLSLFAAGIVARTPVGKRIARWSSKDFSDTTRELVTVKNRAGGSLPRPPHAANLS